MQELTNIGVIREILSRHGFTFQKSLGQNFLINPTVCPRMADYAGAASGRGVLEIGPGLGVLTRALAARAEKVVAVEIDPRLMPVLAETLHDFSNVHIISGDAMRLDLGQLLRAEFGGMPVSVAANLPYYITSPLIMRLLEEKLPIESLTVMVQKEAARRLCALPGQREVGAVSLAVRYYSEPEILFPVSRGSFMPAPDVDSSVIRLTIRQRPPVELRCEADFFRVVKAAFSQRRKTLANTLSSATGLGLAKPAVIALLEEAGVTPGARAEELSMEQFAQVANLL